MFENLAKQWRQARGIRLREELMDSVRRLNNLREADAERFARGLSGAYNYWLKTNGDVKRCPELLRKQMVKEFIALAKERFCDDVGASYAWAFFSFYVESSFLPGDDAAFVHGMTSSYISSADEFVRSST